ncbi:hypothetical protein HYU07_05990 [Candidatus Woesearchaeota archaeon]|nr:hypothetical protein [Candidatus Woesearchaeota archaeon]
MENIRKIESINVVRKGDLPEEVRLDKGIYDTNGFVEIRVERENPAFIEIKDMGAESPGKKFSRLLREAGIR